MSTHTLAITYAVPSGDQITDPYWVRIEQEGLPDEAATVADAAAVIDALFAINPCESAAEKTEAPEPVGEDEFAEAVATAIDLSFCDVEPDGSTETRIKIIRSHLAESYRLQLQGGHLVSTVQVSEAVTVRMEIASQVTLDYPVVAGFACSPEPLRRVGNTLDFDETLSGHTLTATFQTLYDLATIRIPGVDGKPGECRALAFCHGLVADVTLETPSVEEQDYSLCPKINWTAPGEDTVTCYREITVRQRCSCSGDIISRTTREETAECPEGLRCPNNATECMHLLGSDSIDEWVLCADEDDSASYPAFYEQVCCGPPNVQLPRCRQQRTTWSGGATIENGAQHYLDLYGPTTRIVAVSPPGGICGEWVIDQEIGRGNCCDLIIPPVWIKESSAEVLPDNSSGLVYWSASLGPYRVRVAGTGFWTDAQHASTSRTVDEPSATIYTTAACGSATVVVTDACGNTITAKIRSVNGRWERYSQDRFLCDITGEGVAVPHDPQEIYGSETYELISGETKILISLIHPSYTGGCSGAFCPACEDYSLAIQAIQGTLCGMVPDVDFCGEVADPGGYCRCRVNTSYYGKNHYRWVC